MVSQPPQGFHSCSSHKLLWWKKEDEENDEEEDARPSSRKLVEIPENKSETQTCSEQIQCQEIQRIRDMQKTLSYGCQT